MAQGGLLLLARQAEGRNGGPVAGVRLAAGMGDGSLLDGGGQSRFNAHETEVLLGGSEAQMQSAKAETAARAHRAFEVIVSVR